MVNCLMTKCNRQQRHDNKGFSLVELLVCVSIMAIAAVPLMKALGMSAKVNGRAQSIQNATSLAEGVMEEVKSLSTSELESKYGSANFVNVGTATAPVYEMTKTGVTSTQGETFDVKATIKADAYGDSGSPVDFDSSAASNENVLLANSVKLPVLENIDTLTQVALTKQDFTKYDADAENYFANCQAYHRVVTILKKDIVIDKNYYMFGGHPTIEVKCTVTYTLDPSATPVETYTRELYSGTYSKSTDNDLDTNIYLFYEKSIGTETITINDNVPAIGDNSDNDKHKHDVYFINQSSTPNALAGITVTVNYAPDTAIVLTDGSTGINAVDAEGKIERVDGTTGEHMPENSALYTNTGTSGTFYKSEASIRVYDITVEITKTGESTPCATLTSSKEVHETL